MTLLACVKPMPPATAEAGRRITVVGVLDGTGGADTVDTPARFDAAVLEALSVRGLSPELIQDPDAIGRLSSARESSLRVRRLRGEFAEGALFVVETRPGFYAEMNGQYRWVVGVTLALSASEGRPTQQAVFDVPVFLRYHHQQDADAVDAASGVVARRVGELVDDWLRSGG
ncbi:MAG: hypothetical protein EXR71_05895 [Myxococcales bacterium]|nr:hypothetical protein [Myxococcales bacterium]